MIIQTNKLLHLLYPFGNHVHAGGTSRLNEGVNTQAPAGKATPGEDGKSMLRDGFPAVARPRRNGPDTYALLTRGPSRFAAERNPEERHIAYGRLIVVDPNARCPADGRGHHRAFAKEFCEPDLVYRHKQWRGECHVFANRRVLHARMALDQTAGPPCIEQCAMDREDFHNTYRKRAARDGGPGWARHPQVLPGDPMHDLF